MKTSSGPSLVLGCGSLTPTIVHRDMFHVTISNTQKLVPQSAHVTDGRSAGFDGP